jgi:hypothetical protein
MKFSITWERTAEVGRKETFFSPLEHYLESFFYDKSYGEGVISMYIGFSCYGVIPGSGKQPLVFETGHVLHKKYTAAKRRVEISVKINYLEIMAIDSQKAASKIFITAFQSILVEMRNMRIIDFDIKLFEKELLEEVSNSRWLHNVIPQVQWPYNWEEVALKNISIPVHKSTLQPMPVKKFWQLIDQTGAEANYDQELQCELLFQLLKSQSAKQIIGFEVQLRKQLKHLYRYNVLAVAKIVEGHVSDDSFTYFCCSLILLGREVCNQITKEPDSFNAHISGGSGELLLSVADRAFEEVADSSDEGLPHEYGDETYSYDVPKIKMAGDDWEVKDLQSLYPKLTSRYQFKS